MHLEPKHAGDSTLDIGRAAVRVKAPRRRVLDGAATLSSDNMAASEATGSEATGALSMQYLSSAVPGSSEASDLAFGPSDEYDYAQHLKPIGEGTFIQRAGVVRSTADDAASRAAMDDDLWAALHADGEEGDEGEEAREAEEAFIDDLLEAQR